MSFRKRLQRVSCGANRLSNLFSGSTVCLQWRFRHLRPPRLLGISEDGWANFYDAPGCASGDNQDVLFMNLCQQFFPLASS